MKVALVSGGTSGIGKSIVLQLLKEGFKVATFSRSQKGCQDLVHELENISSDFLVLQGDVTDERSLQTVVGSTLDKFGRIDILINNAGKGYFVECDKVETKQLQALIKTNLIGVMNLTKLVARHMKGRASGQIVNIVSISGKVAYAGGEFYSATKFGVMGYSEGIRKELKEYGIKVATICPGMVNTVFFQKLGDDEIENMNKHIWKNKDPKSLQVEDVSNLVSLICNQSDSCDIQNIIVKPF